MGWILIIGGVVLLAVVVVAYIIIDISDWNNFHGDFYDDNS